VCLLLFAAACSSDSSGGGSGAAFNVAGCTITNVSDPKLGLSASAQAAAISELSSTFNNYRLWYCDNSNYSALDSYGDSFGAYTGTDVMLGYTLDWWESGKEGWGYTSVGGGDYLALWGSWH
jgi:hypothetical protein